MSAAGFYHCGVKPVGRGTGECGAVGKSAYRAGLCLFDERTGELHDYRARGGVEETFVFARANAAEWKDDLHRFWNAAEAIEPRANGRIATELVTGLPHELTPAQRKQLLKDFLAPIIERYGVAAQVSIHAPDKEGDWRNWHAHILITHREFGPEGFGEIANRRTVTKKVKGQEKQIEIAGIASTPGDIRALRKEWEKHVNRAYERAGLDIRVDHRSHKERGIAEEPTKHLGPAATAMERRGESSDRGDINREIEARNAALRERAQAEIEAVKAAAGRAAERMLAARLAEAEQRKAAIGRYDDLRPEAVARAADAAKHAAGMEEGPGIGNTPSHGPEKGREGEAAAQPDYAAAKGRRDEISPDRDSYDAAWNDAVAAAGIKAAAEAEREARRQEWVERQRPATKIEQHILDADRAAAGDRARFEAELKEMGIGLARVTAADVQALDSERKAEAVAHAADPSQPVRFIPEIREGELCAVDRHGGVHRLNQFHLEQVGQRYGDLPSIGEIRSSFESERAEADRFRAEMIDNQAQRREEAAHAREMRSQTREAEREARQFDAAARATIRDAGDSLEQTADAGERLAGGLLRSAARIAELVWGTFFAWAMAPPRMTADQAERAERAEEEQAPARAEAARQRAHDAEYDEMDQRRKYARQLEEQQLAALFGGNATAEAQQGRSKDDRPQERELRRE